MSLAREAAAPVSDLVVGRAVWGSAVPFARALLAIPPSSSPGQGVRPVQPRQRGRRLSLSGLKAAHSQQGLKQPPETRRVEPCSKAAAQIRSLRALWDGAGWGSQAARLPTRLLAFVRVWEGRDLSTESPSKTRLFPSERRVREPSRDQRSSLGDNYFKEVQGSVGADYEEL